MTDTTVTAIQASTDRKAALADAIAQGAAASVSMPVPEASAAPVAPPKGSEIAFLEAELRKQGLSVAELLRCVARDRYGVTVAPYVPE